MAPPMFPAPYTPPNVGSQPATELEVFLQNLIEAHPKLYHSRGWLCVKVPQHL